MFSHCYLVHINAFLLHPRPQYQSLIALIGTLTTLLGCIRLSIASQTTIPEIYKIDHFSPDNMSDSLVALICRWRHFPIVFLAFCDASFVFYHSAI